MTTKTKTVEVTRGMKRDDDYENGGLEFDVVVDAMEYLVSVSFPPFFAVA